MTDRELLVFLREQNTKLIGTIESLSQIVEELTEELAALKAAILEKDKDAEKLKCFMNVNLPKKTEKCTNTASVSENKPQAPTPKQRGNNGAKRKVCDNIEECIEDTLPSDASFDEKNAVYLFHRDVIRYEYIPPRLIKHI
ncbi:MULTISPECIES: hypothetical protein [unclassified Carboxylicivirga]|uniref:hypothetical protein n=1 Tax=Carboxylicivirga TaxID=1628153 RepID=UPI003D329677